MQVVKVLFISQCGVAEPLKINLEGQILSVQNIQYEMQMTQHIKLFASVR